jgi:glycosyltransferase involved in cell wall biosynthesis
MISSRNLHLVHNSNWIQQLYSSYSYNSIVVYPPVSWKEYRTNTSKKYVTLINLNNNKGGGVFIEIAKQMPNIEFLGVKGGYDIQIIDERIPNIKYVPNTPKIKEIYEKSQIILMPSKEESWGRVAVEAMSSGIPVIAHPTPGLKEACSYAGLFADRNNISEWVNLIYRLKTDAGFYKKQSDLAFKRAQELDPTPQLQNLSTWLQEIQWKQ